MKIGENIRRLRKDKKLRRSQLVQKLRFIYGANAVDYRTIERIERGDIAKGRLSTLLQIADALDIDVEDIFKGTAYEDKSKDKESSEDVYITRSRARGGIFRYNDKASIEIVSPETGSYNALLLTLEPNSKTKLEQDPEGTIKFLFVIDGEIKILAGSLERVLYKGDSIQINSHKPHYFENTSKKKATAILYQNPKHF